MTVPVFGTEWGEVLGALHGLLALAMLAALLLTVILTFAVSVHNWKHIQIAGFLSAFLYLATFKFGLLIYPRFRVEVREAFLDMRAPGSTGLFEIKEHVAVIGAFIAAALIVLTLFGRLRRASTWRRQLFAALLTMLSLIALLVSVLAYILSARQ